MPIRGSILAMLLLIASHVAAQTPPGQPPMPVAPPPAADPLNNYLLRWEQKMAEVGSLQAQINRTEKDPTFNKTQEYIGFAQYLKDGSDKAKVVNLATLEMRPKARPNDIHEKIICTGTHLFVYAPQTMEIRQYEIPKAKGNQVSQDNVLSFMFGMSAVDARRRYDMKLAKEDTYYVYIDVVPRFPADKAEFEYARLVLNKDNMLPRQLWFKNPGGLEVTWDIPRIAAGVAVKRTDFEAPKPPPGWKIAVQANQPGDGPPKIIRPSGM